MNIRQIRNATLVIEYGGKKFLIDPFLADQGAFPAFPNTPNQDKMNPLVSLPTSIREITDVDAVIVTHLHPDHFDEAAIEALPKNLPIYAQNEKDVATIKEAGFFNVQSLEHQPSFENIQLFKTSGQHGRGEITELTGDVCGVVLKHSAEKTLYIAGDTVWCDDVKEAIDTYEPGVIVVNGGAAQFLEGGPITMTKEDIYHTHQAAPNAKIIVSHMEALNHCLLTRDELKEDLKVKELSSTIIVPNDGETLYNL